MLKRIDRYLWRELWPTFGLALLAFLVFIGLELVLSLSDTLFARGAGAGVILRLLVYKLPSVLALAIPAGVLLAVFLVLSRLASSRELLAFQALGYPLRRILVPFVLFGLLTSGVSFLLSELAVPTAEAAYRRELLSVLYRGEIPSPQEDVFFRGGKGELYYVSRYQGDRAYGIVVYDLSGEIYPHQGPFPVVITAGQGTFSGEELTLREGRVLRFTADGGLEEVVRFNSLTLDVGEEIQQGLLAGKTPGEMSLREIAARVTLFRKSGLDPRNLLVEFHSKLAVVAAAFVFALFGAPVGVLLGRRGRAAGAVAGFVLAAAAQGLFIWTRTLARRGFLPPALGAWLPHILLGTLGVWLLLSVDRLRLRGLWAGLLLTVSLSVLGASAPPPFTELSAQELVIQSGAEVLQATGVWARLGEWELTCETAAARWDGTVWQIEATGAELAGQGFLLTSASILSQVAPSGEIVAASAQDFQGSSPFQGAEAEETLLFRGKWGRARFRDGELVRVEGSDVEFSTCPCIEGAPYSVHAARFVLLPDRWLYAEGVKLYLFGRLAGFLPVYAARLGKEASPLFPEVGRLGGDWFLSWHIPFALQEMVWGALDMRWFPSTGRFDPGLRLVWEEGRLEVAEGSVTFVQEGEGWTGNLRWKADRLQLSFTGRAGDVSWSLAAGEVKKGEVTYQRLPEFSLASGGDWLGGRLSLTLSGGRYKEGEELGWRAGLSLSWSASYDLGPARLSLPVQLALTQYPGAERAVASVDPRLSLGGFSLAYRGRVRAGRSPFSFDRQPPESRVSLNATVEEGGWRETLSFGWDLRAGVPLPGRWTISHAPLQLVWEFTLRPTEFTRVSWQVSLVGEGAKLQMQGGLSLSPFRGEDVLAKGEWRHGGLAVTYGLRLGTFPARLKRLAGAGELSLGRDWSVRVAGEYDALGARFVQLSLALVRTFSGCLRAGMEVYLGGIRFTLEVPAFPQARASFAPLDEGLRLGG